MYSASLHWPGALAAKAFTIKYGIHPFRLNWNRTVILVEFVSLGSGRMMVPERIVSALHGWNKYNFVLYAPVLYSQCIPVHTHPSAGSKPDNRQQMDYVLVWQTSVCDSSLKLDGTVRGYRWMTIIMYWNSFSHRLTCSMNPETAVHHFNQLRSFCSVNIFKQLTMYLNAYDHLCMSIL